MHWSRGKTFHRVMMTLSKTCKPRTAHSQCCCISKLMALARTFGLWVCCILQDLVNQQP